MTNRIKIYRLSGINRATKQHDTVNVSGHDLADAMQLFGLTHYRICEVRHG